MAQTTAMKATTAAARLTQAIRRLATNDFSILVLFAPGGAQQPCPLRQKRAATAANGRQKRKDAQRVHTDQGVGHARREGGDRGESGRSFLERVQLLAPARPGTACWIFNRSARDSSPCENQR